MRYLHHFAEKQTEAQRGWGHVDQVYTELWWHKTLGCSTTAWSPQGRRSRQEHPQGWRAPELICLSPPRLEEEQKREHPEKGTSRKGNIPKKKHLQRGSSTKREHPDPVITRYEVSPPHSRTGPCPSSLLLQLQPREAQGINLEENCSVAAVRPAAWEMSRLCIEKQALEKRDKFSPNSSRV